MATGWAVNALALALDNAPDEQAARTGSQYLRR
jgi:hypothetical protein